MFRALHPDLTIKESAIHGLGVFARADIRAGTILGISHVADRPPRYHCGYIRTPLGAFINHSSSPSCIKVGLEDDDSYSDLRAGKTSSTMAIKTIVDIAAGSELTVFYTIYAIEEGGK